MIGCAIAIIEYEKLYHSLFSAELVKGPKTVIYACSVSWGCLEIDFTAFMMVGSHSLVSMTRGETTPWQTLGPNYD